MRRPGWFLSAIAAGLYIFLYAPIVVIIVFSFNAARFGTVWEGFTTKWYGALLHDSAALSATKNTLQLALVSTGIATLLGSLLAFGLTRIDFPGRKIFDRVLYVPVFVPDIILATSLLLFYSLVGSFIPALELGMTTMILGHVTFQISFVAIVVRARLAGLDPALEEAARDLGAGEWKTFLHVTLPLMLPGVLAGAMLAFTLSLDDFIVSFFTSGPGSTTLPILIYSSVKRGLTPDINALATLIILISVLATISLTWLQKNKQDPHPKK